MEQVFQRKQFTFYESFYLSIEKTLKKKAEKLIAYQCLSHYALYGTYPEIPNIPDTVYGLMLAFIPVLNTARKNAQNRIYGVKAQMNPEYFCNDVTQTVVNKKEKEYKTETETEIETETENKDTSAKNFEQFWQAYPKKVGWAEAEEAFSSVSEPVSVLLSAIKKQKASPQWQKDGGRYIPSPAKWLTGKRWHDDPNVEVSTLSDLELRAIERIMGRAEPLQFP